jgi:hypothetical protein
MLSVQLFMASCDLIAAGLGVCGCASSATTEIQYQLCAEQRIEVEQGAPQDRPRKWCKYYSNGTIDVPTSIYIEAYVYVGSRLCIGDQPPAPARTLEDDLRDQLQARSGKPIASWEPGGEIEIDEPAFFSVEFGSRSVTGQLLGRSATIRFVATSHRWVFSDGDRASGQSVEKVFLDPQRQTAQAFVRVRVDYQISGSNWVIGALEAELPSNLLELVVIERPRRTLLVG